MPLHDGTNAAGQPPPTVAGFVAQPVSEQVYFGESDVAVGAGLAVPAGTSLTISAQSSRGSYQSYELTKIYYIGGAFTLTVEKETR